MDTPLYAHRLGRAYGPDSSRLALETSLRGPIDGLETDICLTSDGELVLVHDPYLPLSTTVSGWAHQASAARIRAGAIRDRAGRPSAERPMTLGELLEATPATLPIQLEVKAHADRALARRTADALCERLETRPDRGRFEVLSFFSEVCERAAARGLKARLVAWADYEPQALASWARDAGLVGVSIEHFLLGEALVDLMRAFGLSVNTGTVNHPALLSRIARLEPDAVCTDRPHELRAAELAAGRAGSAHELADDPRVPVDQRRRPELEVVELGARSQPPQALLGEAPVDEVVASVDVAAPVDLDRGIVAIAARAVGLEDHPATGGEGASQGP